MSSSSERPRSDATFEREWMLRGHQRRVVTPGKNQKFYLAGALDVRTGRLAHERSDSMPRLAS